jgi:hypothetical protein
VDHHAWSDFLTLLEAIPALPNSCRQGDQTLDEWKFAIKSTKPETARGVCALSQPELAAMNDTMLSHLIKCLNRSGRHGLPEWLMLARLFLVQGFRCHHL